MWLGLQLTALMLAMASLIVAVGGAIINKVAKNEREKRSRAGRRKSKDSERRVGDNDR